MNQLLHFARPAKADLSTQSLHEVLDDSLRLMQEQLKQGGIRFVTRLAEEEPFIEADANLLNQALVNLFFNAIDSMQPGGRLELRTDQAKPPWHLLQQAEDPVPDQYIRLTIRDNGCGIPQEILSQVFDPFFTTKDHGTGLGLSISHGIILEHHGLIDVESRADAGTAFHIYFPLVAREAMV